MKDKEFAGLLNELVERRVPFAVATVFKVEGADLGKPGSKAIISQEGNTMYGSLGGACPASAVASAAEKAMKTGAPRVVRVYLESVGEAEKATVRRATEDEVHVDTNRVGTLEVFVEPYLPQRRLILVGQGGKDDIEDALVGLAKALDLEVVVVDHAPELTEQPDELIKDPNFDLSALNCGRADSVIVLTKGERDVATLETLARSKPGFVGLLASARRVADDIAQLKQRKVPSAFIDSIRAPVGADIGAITPAEIALSILTDVVAVKYGKSLPQKVPREHTSVALPPR